jgi:hypothetical protein
MLSEVLEWASVSIGGPLLESMEGRSFYRAFEIKRSIKRCVKMSCKRVSLFLYRGPLGEPGGDSLAGKF